MFFFSVLAITKNNNKILTEDSTKESLVQKLAEMSENSKRLEDQLEERNKQLSTLKTEISKLKV